MVKGLTAMQSHALVELAERKRMAVRIFRSQPQQDAIFEQPRAKYSLHEGGNRAGKTLCSAMLFSAIALDEEITLSTGEKVRARMPHQIGKTLRMWIVAIDQRHIGEVIYPILFKAGAFNVAFDKETKALRAYDREKDEADGIQPKPSPPMIPQRFIQSISWECKADNIFNKVVVIKPGTEEVLAEIYAYTSKGDPAQGRSVSFLWLDEQIGQGEGFVDEMKARLVDQDGQLIWSSWPKTDSVDLEKFAAMLDREIESGNHHIARRVRLTMSGNKALGQKSIDEFLAGCATEEERLARDQGFFITELTRLYPLFVKEQHAALKLGDRLSLKLEVTDGVPPNEWTKYLAIDPGTANPAALALAVPPPEYGDYLVVYQEFYPGRMDPLQLAQYIRKNTRGEKFYKFIIDKRAGRQQTMGMSVRVVDAYSKAFEEVGLTCHTTKNLFVFGSDDVGGRQMAVQRLMHPHKSTGIPKLRIVTHRCPKLVDQLRKVKKKTVNKEVVDDRKARGQYDLVDALEYLVASAPRYVYIPPSVEDGSDAFQRYMKRFGKKKNEGTVRIGTRY